MKLLLFTLVSVFYVTVARATEVYPVACHPGLKSAPVNTRCTALKGNILTRVINSATQELGWKVESTGVTYYDFKPIVGNSYRVNQIGAQKFCLQKNNSDTASAQNINLPTREQLIDIGRLGIYQILPLTSGYCFWSNSVRGNAADGLCIQDNRGVMNQALVNTALINNSALCVSVEN